MSEGYRNTWPGEGGWWRVIRGGRFITRCQIVSQRGNLEYFPFHLPFLFLHLFFPSRRIIMSLPPPKIDH